MRCSAIPERFTGANPEGPRARHGLAWSAPMKESGGNSALPCRCDWRSAGPPGLRLKRLANLAPNDSRARALGSHVECSMSMGGKSPTCFFDRLSCTPASSIPVTELIGTQISFLPQRCPSSRSTWVT
jgi:hypothetical protein